MALVGLLESLMTAKLVDDITDTRSNKTREAWGQGVANLVTGFFGGMGGCAMIGQTMINVKGSGARTRISTFLAGVFLLVLVVVFGDVVALIPMAALVAVMIFVSVGDLRLARHPALDAAPHAQERNRGHGRDRGGHRLHAQPRDRRGPGRARPRWCSSPAGSRTSPRWSAAWTRAGTPSPTRSTASCSSPPSNDLYTQFEYARDPANVVIDMHESHVWDASTVAALEAITTKYAGRGKTSASSG